MAKIAAPRYNLSRIFVLRDRLSNCELVEFLGTELTGEWLDAFIDSVCLHLKRVHRQAVFESVRHLAGTILTDESLKDVTWRLAGNIDKLRRGEAVPPWSVQLVPEWMPVQITAIESGQTSTGKSGAFVNLRVLAGSACPTRTGTFWTKSLCRGIGRQAGFTSAKGDFPLQHSDCLVNMRLWILVEPERCRPGQLGFWEVGCSGGLRKWNREILKKRFRMGWECPMNYKHYCHNCHVGYLQCPAATHKETLLRRE